MKKQQIIIFILADVLCLLFLGCEAVAELFHGPKPEEPPVTYAVTFSANGAIGTPPATKTVTMGTVINLPDENGLKKGAEVFVGWSEGSSGVGIIYSVGVSVTVTKNIVYYAQWFDSSTPQYTVIFDRNEATSGSPPSSQTVYRGISIIIPNQGTLEYSRKTFMGWNTQSDGEGINYLTNAVFTVTNDIILYAKWQNTAEKKLTITGIPAMYNGMYCTVILSRKKDDRTAWCMPQMISGRTAFINMLDYITDKPYIGDGSYYMVVFYIWENLDKLQKHESTWVGYKLNQIIDEETTYISFSGFVEY